MTNDSGSTDLFVYDRVANSVALVSRNTGTGSGNNTSLNPVISGNGAFIAFQSSASNLVSNDSNGLDDVFVYDRVANSVALVSRNTGTGSGNNNSSSQVISGDGTSSPSRAARATWSATTSM